MRAFLPLLAAALACAPLAWAHVDGGPAGTPKTYCETLASDRLVHEYAPPASGFFAKEPVDGNLADCDGDGSSPDYDGHNETSVGGTVFLSCSGWCGEGAGSLACYDAPADHAPFPTLVVEDHALGASAIFWVTADYHDNRPPGSDFFEYCGDYESDLSIQCVGSCVVPIPPGADGAYWVWVLGSAGHVSTL